MSRRAKRKVDTTYPPERSAGAVRDEGPDHHYLQRRERFKPHYPRHGPDGSVGPFRRGTPYDRWTGETSERMQTDDGTKRPMIRRPPRRPAPPPPPVLCKFWSHQGQCRYYPQCRYKHNIRLVARLAHAHDRGIYSIYSASSICTEIEAQDLGVPIGTPVVDIYTASQDKTVKKWVLYSPTLRNPAEPFAENGEGHLKLRLSATVNLDAACLSVFYGQGCLVCGLNNGVIKVFDKGTGHELSLTGHTSEIHCARLIDNVLVSADWAGQLKLWKPDPNQKTFVDTATLDIGSPITCFIEVPVPNGRQLWTGCTGSIKIIDLLTLTLLRTIEIAPREGEPIPIVMSLILADQHIICCLLGGVVKVYAAADATELPIERPKLAGSASGPPENFCSMTGSSSSDGPVLICGKPHGVVSVLGLPNLEERVRFKDHDKDVRAVHNIGGDPSYFVTGAFEGSLCIWYWSNPK